MKKSFSPKLELLVLFWLFLSASDAGVFSPDSTCMLQVYNNSKKDSTPTGIRAFLFDKKALALLKKFYNKEGEMKWKTTIPVYTFDSRTLAMHIDQASSKENFGFSFNQLQEMILSGIPDELDYKENPMYFDKDGYVYTQSKKRWIKTPFTIVKSAFTLPFKAANVLIAGAKLPDGHTTYYGINVNPANYPILEWAFRYKVHYFEAVDNLKKEFVECRGEGGCFKYTLMSGEDKGSYVLFDNYGRLAEINNVNSGYIVYVYGDFSVKLPEARLVGSF